MKPFSSLRNVCLGACATVAIPLACLDGGSLPAAEPSPAAAAAATGWLLVANKSDRTLSIIDPETGKTRAAVPVEGDTGHEVAASPDGRHAFVPIFGSGGVGSPGTDGAVVRVIDLVAGKLVHSIEFTKGMRPHEAVFNPGDGLLYVTTELDDSVTVIDPVQLKIVGRVPTGQPESHMLAITRDGKRAYTSNVGPGSVSVLDLENRRTIKVIPVCDVAQRISLSPDDRWVFTADQLEPRLAIIDTAKQEVARWVPLPGKGYGTAPTPDGRWLLVALITKNQVGVVDLQSMTLARTLDVPAAPQEILIRPDGFRAYVSCDRSGQVACIDLREWKVEKMLQAGKGADGLAWARRPPLP